MLRQPSTSKTGGAAPDTELTPEALANMSDERFAEILNELQARGDRANLMRPIPMTHSLCCNCFVPRIIGGYAGINK